MRTATLVPLLLLPALPACIIHVSGRGVDWSGADGVHHWHGDGPRIQGNGVPAKEWRDVGEFRAVSTTGPFDVTIRVGEETGVEVRGDENVVGRVVAEVVDGTLELELERGRYELERELSVVVTTPGLDAVALTGSGDVDVRGIDAAHFAVLLTGSGDVRLSGRADELDVALRGSGDVSAFGLDASRVGVSISGSGDVDVVATGSVDATVSGSGDVRYRGGGTASATVRGSGSVLPADD